MNKQDYRESLLKLIQALNVEENLMLSMKNL